MMFKCWPRFLLIYALEQRPLPEAVSFVTNLIKRDVLSCLSYYLVLELSVGYLLTFVWIALPILVPRNQVQSASYLYTCTTCQLRLRSQPTLPAFMWSLSRTQALRIVPGRPQQQEVSILQLLYNQAIQPLTETMSSSDIRVQII